MAEEIVYFSYSLDPSVDVPGQEDIFAIDPETRAVRRLTDDSAGLEFVSDRDPRWSPDRTHIAITRAVSDGVPVIAILDAASGDTTATLGEGSAPVWLGVDRVGYGSPYAPNRLLTASLDGQPSDLLTLAEGAFITGLSWHPTKGLAFGYNDPGENPGMVGLVSAAAIERAIASGQAATADDVLLLGRIGGGVILPVWNPEGTAIAVSAYNPTTWSADDTHVGILDPGGQSYQRIETPSDGLIDVSAAWAPDGSRIVFCRGEADAWSDLWLYEVGSRELTQLTHDATARFKGSPDW